MYKEPESAWVKLVKRALQGQVSACDWGPRGEKPLPPPHNELELGQRDELPVPRRLDNEEFKIHKYIVN